MDQNTRLEDTIVFAVDMCYQSLDIMILQAVLNRIN